MISYPDVFLKAQNEIDRVIGRERIPGINDRDDLPYVNAIVKETLRWNNVLPTSESGQTQRACNVIDPITGLPHAVGEEDSCMGYRLPKGAIVLTNIWYE